MVVVAEAYALNTFTHTQYSHSSRRARMTIETGPVRLFALILHSFRFIPDKSREFATESHKFARWSHEIRTDSHGVRTSSRQIRIDSHIRKTHEFA